jgi:hypothetical protein
VLGLVEGGRAGVEAALLQGGGEGRVDAFRVDPGYLVVFPLVPELVPDRDAQSTLH